MAVYEMSLLQVSESTADTRESQDQPRPGFPPKSATSAFSPAATTPDTAEWQLNVLACSLKHGTFSNFFSAAGHGVKKQEISAIFLSKLIFDFLHMPNPCPSRVSLWLWSKIEITAIFRSMIAQEG